MASFAMHLAIAKLYLKTHLEEDEDKFVQGSIEPDLAPYNEKGRTHYGVHAAWSNPAKYLQKNGRNINNSFKRGYFLHLVTDYFFYHVLINIDEVVTKQDLADVSTKQNVDEVVSRQNIAEWRKNQRNDFSILEGEIEDKYEIQDYIDKLPENVKKVMTRAEGELKIFERDSLFKFLEDMAQIDLDKLAEELLNNPEADLINLYNKYCLNEKSAEAR